MSKLKWILAGSSAVLVTGALAFFLHGPQRDRSEVITRGDVMEAAYGVGTVKAEHVYNLKTGAASRVLQRYVRLGDRVKKGDSLILLEGFPTYKAPFDGVVTSLGYDVGELVFSQTAVLSLTNDKSLYLQLTLDERTVWAIKPGQDARISFEGQRDKMKIGKVRSIYADDSNTFTVTVDFDTTGLSLLPGMTGDVGVQIAVHKNKLRAPLGALGTAGELTLLQGNKPQDIHVNVGANDGKYAVIESDQVKEGDRVLLKKELSDNRDMGPH